MKSFAVLTALAGAALASSTIAAPLEPRNIECSQTCGDYVLPSPLPLQITQTNSDKTALLGADQTNLHVNNVALASYTLYPGARYPPGALEFNFQQCNAQGYQQGSSQNSGGSMGAPIEYFGRIAANVAVEYGPGYPQLRCLAAKEENNQGQRAQQFEFTACNDQDEKQWFRLQQGTGGSQVEYFPYKSMPGQKYSELKPYRFYDHDMAKDAQLVQYTQKGMQNTVTFREN